MDKDLVRIAKAAESIADTSVKVKQQLEEQKLALEQKQKKFEAEREEMAKRHKIDDVVELSVSGKHFTTFKSTLCKYEGSMLEAMFSGRHPFTKDSSGRC